MSFFWVVGKKKISVILMCGQIVDLGEDYWECREKTPKVQYFTNDSVSYVCIISLYLSKMFTNEPVNCGEAGPILSWSINFVLIGKFRKESYGKVVLASERAVINQLKTKQNPQNCFGHKVCSFVKVLSLHSGYDLGCDTANTHLFTSDGLRRVRRGCAKQIWKSMLRKCIFIYSIYVYT